MQESEEENHDLSKKSKPLEENGFSMDFEIDFENLWPLDHISNTMYPFLLSTTSEQHFSPIWTFSDVEDDSIAASGNNTKTETENRVENDDKKKHVTPHHVEVVPNLQTLHGYCLIKERMTQALRQFKELTEQNVLAQVWAPVRNGNRYKLTTSGQPFVLDPHSNGLHQYRTVSLMYMFSVDGENDEILGLPGRVFQQKLPEWTPNVQYYSSKEYSRLNHALHYNVRGTLALPVFEPPGQSCVAVLELIMTSQKINYAPEVDKVCKALEAVNLRSSEILEYPYSQICNKDRQNALSEILEILTVVCETHNLPLAQTWVPCRHRSVLAHGGGLKKSCSSFDGYCMGQVCMSITEVAFYVIDSHTWGFHDACVEHHLQQGQGVSGRAFLTQNMCFCENITQFCKTDYPLVHYALMFDLTSCFSICLQSSHTGNDEYVLEFFLPPSIIEFCEHKALLGSILAIMKQNFQSLKVASGFELEEDGSIEIVEILNGRVHSRVESVPIIQSEKLSTRHDDASPNMEEGVLPLDPLQQKVITSFDDINDRRILDVNTGGNIDRISSLETKTKKKTSQRKRGKAEKSISLDVLQNYFSGSLKDAAKSLGVCPTTMKRICRQHGISRWPSRKIKKVNRSLSKLKCVIESVHGVEGAFGLNSPTTSPLHIASSSFNQPSTSNKFEHQTALNIIPSEPKMNENYLNASKSQPQEPFIGMLIEGADSCSKDLKNMCPLADTVLEDQILEASRTNPPCFDFAPLAEKEMKIVTIKATYRDDIIRFRVSLNCGIVELREEISKRLKLEVGTFDIKYMDDDQEWILVACDADLQECMDILTSSGSNIIRLVVHDIVSILGSSVEISE